MKFLKYLFFILFILASHNFWGTVQLYKYSLLIGTANTYLIDWSFFFFVSLSLPEILASKKGKKEQFLLNKEMILFLCYGVFIAFYSIIIMGVTFRNTFRGVSEIFYYAIYFGIPFLMKNKKDINIFVWILFINSLVAVSVNIYQNFTGWEPGFVEGVSHFSKTIDMGGIYRAYNPSNQWIIFSLCFLYVILINYKISIIRLLYFCVLTVAMLLTFIRNVYIGFILISFFLLALGIFRWRKRWKLNKTVFGVVLVGMIFYVALSYSYPIFDRFQSSLFEIKEKTGTFGERLQLSDIALRSLKGVQLYLGSGYGQLSDTLDSSQRHFIEALQSGADSGIINILLRLGIVGLIFYVIINFKFIIFSWKRLNTTNLTLSRTFYMGAISYSLWIWTQSFASNMFLSSQNSIILIIIWSMGDRLAALEMKQNEK